MDTGAGTGTGLDTLRNELEHTLVTDGHDTSALDEGFEATPIVVPVRGHLDSIKRLVKGDRYIGRGSRQRSLGKSRSKYHSMAARLRYQVSVKLCWLTEFFMPLYGHYQVHD